MTTIKDARVKPEPVDTEMLAYAIQCYDDKSEVEKYHRHDNFKIILQAARLYAQSTPQSPQSGDRAA